MKDPKEFAKKHFKEQVEKLSSNKEKVIDITSMAEEKAKNKANLLKDAMDDLLTFFRLIRAYYNGTYRDI